MIGRAANYLGISSSEFLTALSLGFLLIAFKSINILCHAFDSDEAQHLHVIWGWTRGLVQYRDLFDNHMPLFQILYVPIFGLVGERATALFWMRFLCLPTYFLAAWSTYRIGALLFSKAVGLWAVILAGFYAAYHFPSLEFRTDNLWAAFWLVCLTSLFSGQFCLHRAIVAGLLLGFCFGVSLKSTVFLVVLISSALSALFFVGPKQSHPSWGNLALCTSAFLISMLIVPGVIMIFFALQGVWSQFRYCVFEHNLLPGLDRGPQPAWRILVFFPVAFPFVIFAARLIARDASDPALAFRRGFAALVCGLYVPVVYTFWALATRQDFLPSYPLVFIFFTAALFAVATRLQTHAPKIGRVVRPVSVVVIVALCEFVFALWSRPFWANGAKVQTDLLRDVLKLTDPTDYVFDCKGETIFRNRCTWLIMEKLTRERIARGLLTDNVPQRCIATHTCVAAIKNMVPEKAGAFVQKNYLPVTPLLRVAGVKLETAASSNAETNFEVVIPASYQIIAPDTQVTGTLDGAPYDGARFLEAGPHRFAQTSNARELVLLWSRAVDRHYLPVGVAPLTLH